MDIKNVSSSISVAAQISVADVAALARAGFRSIVCNRPDGEAPEQSHAAQIAAAAQQHGLAFYFQPVISGQVSDADADEFAASVDALQGPVLAYCRTGTRCITLWALAEACNRAPSEILQRAHELGYNLDALQTRLQARHDTHQSAAG